MSRVVVNITSALLVLLMATINGSAVDVIVELSATSALSLITVSIVDVHAAELLVHAVVVLSAGAVAIIVVAAVVILTIILATSLKVRLSS